MTKAKPKREEALASDADTLFTQYLQSVLANWRKNNRWADDIPFEKFPEKYRAELQYTASMKMEIGGYR